MTTETQANSQADPYVVVGSIQGHFGVKGWVKVQSFTRPPLDILGFDQWGFVKRMRTARQQDRSAAADTVGHCDLTYTLAEGRWHGKGIIARLENIHSREDAEALMGATIVVHNSQFEQLDDGDFYWTDLVGLLVKNDQGIEFGMVDHLVETGANDVLVIHKKQTSGEMEETLIPWSRQYVTNVDLETGVMLVDWDAD